MIQPAQHFAPLADGLGAVPPPYSPCVQARAGTDRGLASGEWGGYRRGWKFAVTSPS